MRYINNADKNSKIIQFANKNIIIHHYGKPVSVIVTSLA